MRRWFALLLVALVATTIALSCNAEDGATRGSGGEMESASLVDTDTALDPAVDEEISASLRGLSAYRKIIRKPVVKVKRVVKVVKVDCAAFFGVPKCGFSCSYPPSGYFLSNTHKTCKLFCKKVEELVPVNTVCKFYKRCHKVFKKVVKTVCCACHF